MDRLSTDSVQGDAFVMPLAALTGQDLELAGGKGANLGELLAAGMPVPPGFAVTTTAYDRFVGETQLQALIEQTLDRLGEQGNAGKPDGLGVEDGQAAPHDQGAAIRAALERAPIPPPVEEAIRAAYQQLGQGPVAVRSSATAEDLPGAAFAGQQDTFLNVIGADELLAATRRCWASLWTDRAMAYRARLGIDQKLVKIAVVVQRMVAADAAGVLFTANTVTGARDEMVIDASPGLGEAVVSGQVTPDHYILRRRWWGWQIVERRAGRREVIIRARAGGGTEQVAGPDALEMPALPEGMLRRLAALGATIEGHFGRPQDIEWAWADGHFSILQARPITALAEAAPRPTRSMRMLAAILAEMMPTRPYPLEVTTWGPKFLVSALLGAMFRTLGLALHLDRAFVEEEGVLVRLTDRFPLQPTPAILLAPLRLARLARTYNPAMWEADSLLAEAQTRVRELGARNLTELEWPALVKLVEEALAIPRLVGELRKRYLLPLAPAVGLLRLTVALLGAGDRFGTLLFTGIESRTMQANQRLEEVAATIRADDALAALFADHDAQQLWAILKTQREAGPFFGQLQTFLDAYGHRETGGTLQISEPSWREAPEAMLGILKGLAERPSAEQTSAPERQVQTTTPPAWQAVRNDLLRHPLLRIPLLRRGFVRLLTRARYFPLIREDTRFYATMAMPVVRRTLLEMGRRLADTGLLARREGAFHLRMEGLAAVGKLEPPAAQDGETLAELVARRKAKRAALANRPLVDPRLFQSQGTALPDALVSGIGGSPGVAEGVVRVIRHGSEFGKLRGGDVLVCEFTNPAWTPLFQRAAAVVVDSGGPGSHAAIVAREYGIPAVMGCVTGTQVLRDGDRVRVDGSRGAVFRAQNS